MRKIIFILFSGIFLLSCEAQKSGIQDMSASDFKKSLKETSLLDVRTSEEYAEGHIHGAKNIDWHDPAFLKKVEAQVPDKNKTLYVYCRSGGRSAQTATALAKAGYTSIVNLDGGIIDWKNAGLPTE